MIMCYWKKSFDINLRGSCSVAGWAISYFFCFIAVINFILICLVQALREELYIAQGNEMKAKDELQQLREEIRAEKASVQAARHIDKKERELRLRNDMVTFHQTQQRVDGTINELANAASHLPPVKIETGGKTYGMLIIMVKS